MNSTSIHTAETSRQVIERRALEHPLLRDWKLQFVASHSANSSDVLEYKRLDQRGAPRLMIKHRNRAMSRDASRCKLAREFQALEGLWQRAAPPFRETIPRPVTLLPEVGAAVFEAVPGIQMRLLLRRKANCVTGRLHQRRLYRIGWRAGEWLRHFHGLTPGPVIEHGSAGYLTKLSYWLEKSQAAGLERTTVDALWETASKADEKARRAPAPTAGIHGDFCPQNIIVARERIAVIDFASFKEADVIYEDLGFLVAYWRLLASAPRYSRRAITAMTRGFLEGYGALAESDLLNLYALKSTVMIFADQFAGGETYRAQCRKIRRIERELARIPFA